MAPLNAANREPEGLDKELACKKKKKKETKKEEEGKRGKKRGKHTDAALC